MMRPTIVAFALAALTLSGLARTGAQAGDQYWRWGWGLYDLLGPGEVLDSARFDWTFVLFGNRNAPESKAAQRAKEILRLNPNHRFVLRVWPIIQLGKLPNNKFQATLFDYLYAPGIREQVLARARQQVRYFMDQVGERNVAGATFLEELPHHFTSTPFGAEWRKWKRGDKLPWDMEPFKQRIRAELGAPFDLHNREHRRWWGRRYSAAIAEIGRAIKLELGGKPVFYYQHSLVPLLDDVASVGRVVDSLDDAEIMPVRYQDVVGKGRADGLFVYPTNSSIRKRRFAAAERLGTLVFGQVSLPSPMRGALAGMISLARTRYAYNLGSFLFPTIGDPLRERAYSDREYRFTSDLIRRFAWDQRIHPEIVDRHLSPVIEFEPDRDMARMAVGDSVRIHVYVWNRRDPSWYGSDYALATLKGIELGLVVASGFRVDGAANARQAILSLDDLGPQDGRAAEWLVHRVAADDDLSSHSPLTISLRTGNGSVYVASPLAERAREVASHRIREIDRSGAAWIEPSKLEASCRSAVEIRPLEGEVDSPMIARKGVARILYRGILPASSRLVMGPGSRGRIYAEEIFDGDIRHFGSLPRDDEGTVTIVQAGHFYSAGGPSVRSGERYRLLLEGWASSDEMVRVVAQFSGSKNGSPAVLSTEASTSSLSTLPGTAMSSEIDVPQFDSGLARLSLSFFRLGSGGALFLRRFSVRRTDLPADGQDVSTHIVGSMPCEAPLATAWTYYDRSPVAGGTRTRVSVRLLN